MKLLMDAKLELKISIKLDHKAAIALLEMANR